MGLISRMFVGMCIADASATVPGLLAPYWRSDFPGNPRDLAGLLVQAVCSSDPPLVHGDMPLPSRHALAAASLSAGLVASREWPSMGWQEVPVRSALRSLLGSPLVLSPSSPGDSLLFLRAASSLSAG